MLEYGYALKQVGYGVILPIMNTFFGPPKELPFDMGHLKFPVEYKLEPGAVKETRTALLNRLAAELERILRLMIAEAKPTVVTPFPKAEALRPPAFFFRAGEALAQFGQYKSEREYYQFSAATAAFLRLFPTAAQPQPIGRAKLQAFSQARKLPPMARNSFTGLIAQNSYGSITFDPIARSDMSALTQAFPSGELWGITRQCFANYVPRSCFEDGQEVQFVTMIDFERIFQRALDDYVEFATTQLGFKPPFTVIAGATGLTNFQIGYPSREYSGREYAQIHVPNFERTYSLPDVQHSDLEFLLRQFFEDFWDLAGRSRDELLTDDAIRARDLIPRRAQ